jgi:hypothetical protein
MPKLVTPGVSRPLLRRVRPGVRPGHAGSSADLEAGVLVVDHTILELNGHLVDGVPKTAAGVRRVYLDAETARLLRAHRKSQPAARLRAGCHRRHLQGPCGRVLTRGVCPGQNGCAARDSNPEPAD